MRGRTLSGWLDALASRSPTPAGGSLAFATLAGCAALCAKLSRLSGGDGEGFENWGARFLEYAEEDARAYAPGRSDSFAGELQRAESALEFISLIDGALNNLPLRATPDIEAARGLARVSVRILSANLRANLGALQGEGARYADRAEAIARRAT